MIAVAVIEVGTLVMIILAIIVAIWRDMKRRHKEPETHVMTVEELKEIAKSMGYNIIPIKKYEKYLPCTCGNNRREQWETQSGVKISCTKCGKSAEGKTMAEAKRNWNKAISECKEGE